jgi:hypothetical protein
MGFFMISRGGLLFEQISVFALEDTKFRPCVDSEGQGDKANIDADGYRNFHARCAAVVVAGTEAEGGHGSPTGERQVFRFDFDY